MNVFISGQKMFGEAAFRLALSRGHKVIGVSAPHLSGDGKRGDRLRAAALDAGVPVMAAGSLNASTLPAGVDVILAAHSHDFISGKTRRATKLGAVGYHPSLLPVHRGRDAVRWAVKMGDRVTGGTVFWLNDNLDGGDIAAQEHAFIHPGETAEALWRDKLFPLGIRLFARVLADLEKGVIIAIPQDNRIATWEPSIDRPPLFRPDLPMLGAAPDGFRVVKVAESAPPVLERAS